MITFPQREPWMTDAACARTDGDAFFPDKGESPRAAKRVCENCPVRDECLQWALQNKERWGVLGGMSERERRKLMEVAA